MYSKKTHNSLPPRRPEHYNGWAFQPPAPPRKDPPQKEERPAPLPPKNPPYEPPHQSYPRPLPFLPPPDAAPQQSNGAPPPFPPPALANLLGQSPLLSSLNFDFEELLLIGLIVLLAKNGEDNELPLLLALLLLC